MSKQSQAKLELIKRLPASTRRKMNLIDLKAITGAVLIQDRIAQHFVLEARSRYSVTQFKREHGYCGGFVTCMTYTGNGSTCKNCLVNHANPKHKNTRSEYGLLSKQRKDAARARKVV